MTEWHLGVILQMDGIYVSVRDTRTARSANRSEVNFCGPLSVRILHGPCIPGLSDKRCDECLLPTNIEKCRKESEKLGENLGSQYFHRRHNFMQHFRNILRMR